MKIITALTIICIFVCSACFGAADWPQVAGNPARTSRTIEQPVAPYSLHFYKSWDHQVLTNTNSPIMADGVLYVASENGIVHAVDLATGSELWEYDLGGFVRHALACDGNNVYAASLNGTVYAIDRITHQLAWSTKASYYGFSCAPLLADGMLLIGNRDGIFYAFDTADGCIEWNYDSTGPIFQTAAAADGKVVFANEKMTAFCLEISDGSEVWTVPDVPGRSFRDFWPVIVDGRVYLGGGEAGAHSLTGRNMLLHNQLVPRATDLTTILAEQDTVQNFYVNNPLIRPVVVYDLATGNEPITLGLQMGCCNTGNTPPACVGPDGNLYWALRTSAYDGGNQWEQSILNIARCIFGRINTSTGKFDHLISAYSNSNLEPMVGFTTPFELTSDETVMFTSAGALVFGIRSDIAPSSINIYTRQTAGCGNLSLPRGHDTQTSGNPIAIHGRYIAVTKFRHIVVWQASDYLPGGNQMPQVDAGNNQQITLPDNDVDLDATVSDDGLPVPPAAVTVNWTKESGPGTVTFGDANAVDTTAAFSAEGTYVLRLTADDSELTNYDEVTITVYPEGGLNQPPLVDAGVNQQITLPDSDVDLDATVSDDGLPAPPAAVTVHWTKQSGPGTVTFGDANAVDTTAAFSEHGVYVLRLTADDSELTDYDELTITVNQQGGTGSQTHIVFDGEYQNGWGGVATTTFQSETVLNVTGGDWAWFGLDAAAGQNLSALDSFQYQVYFDSAGVGSTIEWHVVAPDGEGWNSNYKISAPATVDGSPASLPMALSTDTWHTVAFDMSAQSWWPADSGDIRHVKWQWVNAVIAYIRDVKFTGPCIAGDVNCDGTVDFVDIGKLAEQWLWAGSAGAIDEDIIEDGAVDFIDFAAVANDWLD